MTTISITNATAITQAKPSGLSSSSSIFSIVIKVYHKVLF